jgi:anti-sigma-K factor RskA
MNFIGRDAECEERGQAAAYVLRALEPEEAERYREHLEGCAACSADVLRLQPAADSLAAEVPRLPAPAELGGRVMASVGPEAELLRAAGAEADRPPRASRVRWRWSRAQALVAVVAMGIGLLIGATAINTGEQAPVTRTIPAQVTSSTPGARAVVRQVGGHAELVVSGIAPPPPGKIYEIWLAREGSAAPQATNALFGVSRVGGRASVDVPGSLGVVLQVLVTAEPLGGSSHPTSTPIIVAKLRS